MDFYYGRPPNPHKRVGMGPDILLTDPDEIAAYWRGYNSETERKDFR